MKCNFLSPKDFETNYKYGIDVLSIAESTQWEFDRAAIDMDDYSICHAYFFPTPFAKDKSRKMEICCKVTKNGPEYQIIYTPYISPPNNE